MNNWAGVVQTHINTVQIRNDAVETGNGRVETDCSPSLQTNETQPNEKI